MIKIKGISASDGIEIKKIFIYEDVSFEITEDKISDTKAELKKLQLAFGDAEKDLLELRNATAKNIDEENAMVFDAHIQILNDPQILNQVEDLVQLSFMNVVYAYNSVCDKFISVFSKMDNEYMRERASDIKDVQKRVIAKLLGVTLSDPTQIDEEVIVVAHDLTPSETAQLNKKYVKGFITAIGGKTSHSAIMARTQEIPAVVGVSEIMNKIKNDDLVILDGTNGDIIIQPDIKTLEYYKDLKNKLKTKKTYLQKYINLKTLSRDKVHVELAANIGSPDDIESAINNGAEGIGLFRTEFLYMKQENLPSEDEQYRAYRVVLEAMRGKKVIIRTLDIGGDKKLDYLKMDEELNPHLGNRSLRLFLKEKNIFKTQIKALLRAGIHGNLHILFPMVATLEELAEAKEVIEECKTELNNEDIKHSETYKIGIMIEIPAAALLADKFAKEVDFFSIGTNDLIQYLFAADRMNEKVSYLYQPYNPSLLKIIKMVIDASHKNDIWTGMCGEMASDHIAIPLLFGLGLDEFSMSASSILSARHLISTLSKADTEVLAEKALELNSNEEVIELVKKQKK